MSTTIRIAADARSEAWLQPSQGPRLILERTCSLGRLPDNTVTINAAKASRYHATIHAQDATEFWLVDLGSRNGTFHNGRRVLRPTLLRDGDRLTLADVTFLFRQIISQPKQAVPPAIGSETIVEFKDQVVWLLMADLKGSSALSQRLPREEWGRLLGGWMQECHDVVEEQHGQIGKYLGDGFLAYWPGEESEAAHVLASLRRLAVRDAGDELESRVVVHRGTVTFGGATALGEERMLGADVNFIFRLERLASALGLGCCLSAAAHEILGPLAAVAPLPGEHEIKGFPGTHRFFTFDGLEGRQQAQESFAES